MLWNSEEKVIFLQRPTPELHNQGQAGCGLGKVWTRPHQAQRTPWRQGSAVQLRLRSQEGTLWSLLLQCSSVQFSSVAQSCPTLCDPWTAACQVSLSVAISQSLLKLMPIELVMSSSHLILCYPLLLLPPIPPSIRVFSNESTLRIRWPKYWSFGFSISPSNEHSGLISFRMDWLDLLAVQGTLKSLLQHHSSKASWQISP